MWFRLQGTIIEHKRGVSDVPAGRDVASPNKIKSVSIVHPGVIALCQTSPFVTQALSPNGAVTTAENSVDGFFGAIRSENVVYLWMEQMLLEPLDTLCVLVLLLKKLCRQLITGSKSKGMVPPLEPRAFEDRGGCHF